VGDLTGGPRGLGLLDSGRAAVRYAKHRGLQRAARKLFRAFILGRQRIYLTRSNQCEVAALPLRTNGVEVRLARPNDPLVEAFPHLTISKIATWLAPDHLMFVILCDGRLVGYRCVSTKVDPSVSGFLGLRPHQIYTVFMYTNPEHRQHGLTRITRIAVARELVKRGFREAWSAESPTNHNAVIATERKGPIRVGTLTRTSLLGRVGFSMTPVTTLSPQLIHRQLTQFKEIARSAASVGLLFNPSVTIGVEGADALKSVAAELGAELTLLPVRETADQTSTFHEAFATALKQGVTGLIVLSDPMMKDHRRTIVALVNRYRLAALFDAKEFVAAGGLMACGTPAPCLRDFDSLLAYLDTMDAAGHPPEAGDEPELVVNRHTAAALGLVVPPTLR